MKLPPFQLSAEGELRSSGAAAAALADMGLLALYGRVYCYLRCRNAAVVKLYRFYKYVAHSNNNADMNNIYLATLFILTVMS